MQTPEPEFKAGDRVQLVLMGPDPDPIPAGTRGEVTYSGMVSLGGVPVWEQVSVRWENGRRLMLTIPPDVLVKLEEK